jgi:hypothetical protein
VRVASRSRDSSVSEEVWRSRAVLPGPPADHPVQSGRGEAHLAVGAAQTYTTLYSLVSNRARCCWRCGGPPNGTSANQEGRNAVAAVLLVSLRAETCIQEARSPHRALWLKSRCSRGRDGQHSQFPQSPLNDTCGRDQPGRSPGFRGELGPPNATLSLSKFVTLRRQGQKCLNRVSNTCAMPNAL